MRYTPKVKSTFGVYNVFRRYNEAFYVYKS